jgi:hypothetical protein
MRSGDRIKQVLGLATTASDEVAGSALRDVLAGTGVEPISPSATMTVDDPQADFEKLAELYARVHSVSLAEGYSEVSRQCPTLYARARERANR